MLFNSLVFLLFMAVVYATYFACNRRISAQNALLLVASYVFYGWWDWRFLTLLATSTVIDFIVGRCLHAESDETKRRRWVTLSVFTNLGILGFFKYFNFFADSLVQSVATFGFSPEPILLDVVLPVGISFYTFQTLSYTIDIYRRDLEPENNLLNFAVFVAFFPQLVAGPIERARTMLPQIRRTRTVDASNVNDGVFLIVWGFFKKVVIADNLATIANPIFDSYQGYEGLDLVIAALAFTGQIYCDFSGYSDIARGISKTLGFELMVNFKLPYFATSPSDFWRRWHISLSTWLRDYLYIPLGGNRSSAWLTYRNLFLTMLLGGLWHGAAWNFVVWGAYHGILLIVARLLGVSEPDSSRRLRWLGQWLVMFVLTVIGWIIFRAPDLPTIVHFCLESGPGLSGQSLRLASKLLFFSAPLIVMMLWLRQSRDLLAPAHAPWFIRSVAYGLMLAGILVFGVREPTEFLYFQF